MEHTVRTLLKCKDPYFNAVFLSYGKLLAIHLGIGGDNMSPIGCVRTMVVVWVGGAPYTADMSLRVYLEVFGAGNFSIRS